MCAVVALPKTEREVPDAPHPEQEAAEIFPVNTTSPLPFTVIKLVRLFITSNTESAAPKVFVLPMLIAGVAALPAFIADLTFNWLLSVVPSVGAEPKAFPFLEKAGSTVQDESVGKQPGSRVAPGVNVASTLCIGTNVLKITDNRAAISNNFGFLNNLIRFYFFIKLVL